METKTWLEEQIKTLAKDESQFTKQAFYQELLAFVDAQYLRIEQGQGEIDGRSWNHQQW